MDLWSIFETAIDLERAAETDLVSFIPSPIASWREWAKHASLSVSINSTQSSVLSSKKSSLPVPALWGNLPCFQNDSLAVQYQQRYASVELENELNKSILGASLFACQRDDGRTRKRTTSKINIQRVQIWFMLVLLCNKRYENVMISQVKWGSTVRTCIYAMYWI